MLTIIYSSSLYTADNGNTVYTEVRGVREIRNYNMRLGKLNNSLFVTIYFGIFQYE